MSEGEAEFESLLTLTSSLTLDCVHECFFCPVKYSQADKKENNRKNSAVHYTAQIKIACTGKTIFE
jgi:hypothetical protein